MTIREYTLRVRGPWGRDRPGIVTRVLLFILQKINPHKDRTLAWRLHDIADQYDTRPSGQWRQP
jgi:hypothetical protein